MNLIDSFTVVTTAIGMVFFFTGTLGLLRFPDFYCRLHALTKTDNLGLGFITLGLLPQTFNFFSMAQLIIIWLLIMFSGAIGSFLLAQYRLVQQNEKKILTAYEH